MKKATIFLLCTGLLVPVIFWLSTIIAANMQEGYSHSRDTISQLGAIGTSSQHFMAAATWVCVLLSLLFMAGLWRACNDHNASKWPLIGVLGFSIMFGWAAFFPSGHPLHAQSGPVLLLLLAGPLLSAWLFKGGRFNMLRSWSLLAFVLMLCILLRVVLPASWREHYTGLLQRMVHLGWTVWFIALSGSFIRLRNHWQPITPAKADDAGSY